MTRTMSEQVTITVEDRFHCSKETFVRLTFDEGFNTALHEHLGFRTRTVIRRDEDDGQIRQRIEYITGVRIPWVIRKLAGREWAAYWEEQVFDRQALTLATELEPMMLKGRIESNGLMRFLDDEEAGWMRRTYEINVSVGVPMAGNAIAKRIVSDVKASYQLTAQWVDQYLKDHDLEGQ